jgi:hypothetical protein
VYFDALDHVGQLEHSDRTIKSSGLVRVIRPSAHRVSELYVIVSSMGSYHTVGARTDGQISITQHGLRG